MFFKDAISVMHTFQKSSDFSKKVQKFFRCIEKKIFSKEIRQKKGTSRQIVIISRTILKL